MDLASLSPATFTNIPFLLYIIVTASPWCQGTVASCTSHLALDEGHGKMTEMPYLADFLACIIKFKLKIMKPSFLTFFDPGHIEPATVFSPRLVVHTLCLEKLYGLLLTCSLLIWNFQQISVFAEMIVKFNWRRSFKLLDLLCIFIKPIIICNW